MKDNSPLPSRYLSVTALTRYLKRKLESDAGLQDIWLKGEISNFKRHSRGHMYMTIKDRSARIQAVMFAGNNRRLTFEPENGMKVLIRGEISVYEPYGQYQLYIKEMEQDGLGRLYLAFEALKKKLEERGLFAAEAKKPLPAIPYEIGIVTSPTGAAVRDLFTTIKRRFPAARLTLFPVLVQGEGAAPSIVSAIEQANQLGDIDLLIVGRGGGSVEELWAFNEETVAYAIHRSVLPIISAVGHETDFTIADFVADLRAATPTAAGELAVPHIDDLTQRIHDLTRRLHFSAAKKIESEKERLSHLQSAYAFKYPEQLLLRKEQELDHLSERLVKQLKRNVDDYQEKTVMITRLLKKHHPAAKINQCRDGAKGLTERLERAILVYHKGKKARFERSALQLNALSPLKIMARGYNLAYNQSGRLLKSTKEVEPGDPIQIKMNDGTLDCQVWGIEEMEKNGRKK